MRLETIINMMFKSFMYSFEQLKIAYTDRSTASEFLSLRSELKNEYIFDESFSQLSKQKPSQVQNS